jgi:hypothetical protein
MGRKRFKPIGMGSFFGDLVYWEVIPADHFLTKWSQFAHSAVH